MLALGITAYYVFVFGFAGILVGRVNEYGWGGAMPGFLKLITWVAMFLTGPLMLIVALPLRLLGIRMYPIFIPTYMKDGGYSR